MVKKASEKVTRVSTEKLIKEIRRNTQKSYTSEQKILIVMEGMRAELSIAKLCRNQRVSRRFGYSL